MTLYRPVGLVELRLLQDAGFTRWPPRLPEQPIFYPVANEDYAMQIARDWNCRESGYGAVTRFRVRREFLERYQMQQVGSAIHREWWIPAEDLDLPNAAIVGSVEVLHEYGAVR